MRPYLVMDCSFLMSSILPDETNNRHSNTDDYSIHVPAIFFLECTNVLLLSRRKNRISPEIYETMTQLLSELPFHIDSFSATQESVFSIGLLANKFELTTYDASYLELAIRLKADIATHDKKLLQALKEISKR